MIPETKVCKDCGEDKAASEFSVVSNGWLASYCKSCVCERSRLRYAADPARHKIAVDRWNAENPYRMRAKKLGVNVDVIERLFEEHQGQCAICGNEETAAHQNGKIKDLAIDHCHRTGMIRGLLCQRCNTGLGGLGDNIDQLFSAIEYLEKYSPTIH